MDLGLIVRVYALFRIAGRAFLFVYSIILIMMFRSVPSPQFFSNALRQIFFSSTKKERKSMIACNLQCLQLLQVSELFKQV